MFTNLCGTQLVPCTFFGVEVIKMGKRSYWSGIAVTSFEQINWASRAQKYRATSAGALMSTWRGVRPCLRALRALYLIVVIALQNASRLRARWISSCISKALYDSAAAPRASGTAPLVQHDFMAQYVCSVPQFSVALAMLFALIHVVFPSHNLHPI